MYDRSIAAVSPHKVILRHRKICRRRSGVTLSARGGAGAGGRTSVVANLTRRPLSSGISAFLPTVWKKWGIELCRSPCSTASTSTGSRNPHKNRPASSPDTLGQSYRRKTLGFARSTRRQTGRSTSSDRRLHMTLTLIPSNTRRPRSVYTLCTMVSSYVKHEGSEPPSSL